MEANVYYKDGVARVLELMKDTFGDYFKGYFEGELVDIPEVYLPCIMVSETTGSIQSGATGTDEIIERVTIGVVFNKKDDIGASPESDLTAFKLRKIVKGQDPSSSYPYQYLPQTIMYALRTNITLDGAIVDNQIDIEFGGNVRTTGGGNTMLQTEEAVVTLTLQRNALVPSRS